MRTVEWCDDCNDYHPAGEHTKPRPTPPVPSKGGPDA